MNTSSFVYLKQVVISETQFDGAQLTSTTAVAEFARNYTGDNYRETLIVIGINTKPAINIISIASIEYCVHLKHLQVALIQCNIHGIAI